MGEQGALSLPTRLNRFFEIAYADIKVASGQVFGVLLSKLVLASSFLTIVELSFGFPPIHVGECRNGVLALKIRPGIFIRQCDRMLILVPHGSHGPLALVDLGLEPPRSNLLVFVIGSSRQLNGLI